MLTKSKQTDQMYTNNSICKKKSKFNWRLLKSNPNKEMSTKRHTSVPRIMTMLMILSQIHYAWCRSPSKCHKSQWVLWWSCCRGNFASWFSRYSIFKWYRDASKIEKCFDYFSFWTYLFLFRASKVPFL